MFKIKQKKIAFIRYPEMINYRSQAIKKISRPFRDDVRMNSLSPRRIQRPFFYTSIEGLNNSPLMKPFVSQDQIVRQIENSLTTALIGVTDKFEIFDCYRHAFDRIIRNFGKQSAAISRVKDGYDQLISSLKNNTEKGFSKIEKKKRSIGKYSENLSLEKEKIDRKRKSLNTLLGQINDVRSELIAENNEHQQNIKRLINSLSEQGVIVKQKSNNLSYLITDLSVIETRRDNSVKALEEYQKNISELTESLKNCKTLMETELKEVYEKNESVKKLKDNIIFLNSEYADIKDQYQILIEKKSLLKENCSELNSNVNVLQLETNSLAKQNQKIYETIKMLQAFN